MQYVISKKRELFKEMTYRVYVTDSLYYQGQSQYLTTRYLDIINPKKVDTRTPDEIVQDVIKNAGLVVK